MASAPPAVYSDAPYKRIPHSIDVQDLYIRGSKLATTGSDVGLVAVVDEHEGRLDAVESSVTTINSSLALKEDKNKKDAVSGYAGLDSSAKLPITTLATLPQGGLLTSTNGTSNSFLSPGTNGQILSVGGSGVLSWIAAPTSGSGVSDQTTMGTLRIKTTPNAITVPYTSGVAAKTTILQVTVPAQVHGPQLFRWGCTIGDPINEYFAVRSGVFGAKSASSDFGSSIFFGSTDLINANTGGTGHTIAIEADNTVTHPTRNPIRIVTTGSSNALWDTGAYQVYAFIEVIGPFVEF